MRLGNDLKRVKKLEVVENVWDMSCNLISLNESTNINLRRNAYHLAP